MKTNVNANLVRIASAFVSTDMGRYYIQGVFIQKHPTEGVYIVATDGHRMFVAHDKDGTTEHDGIIVRLSKEAQKTCKAGRGEPHDRRLVLEGKEGNVTITDFSGNTVGLYMPSAIDGNFPDWQRIARPSDLTGKVSAFNGRYLGDFGIAAKELSGSREGTFLIEGGGDSPALIRFPATDHAYGVLMPIRWGHSSGIPAFMDAQPETTAQAA